MRARATPRGSMAASEASSDEDELQSPKNTTPDQQIQTELHKSSDEIAKEANEELAK